MLVRDAVGRGRACRHYALAAAATVIIIVVVVAAIAAGVYFFRPSGVTVNVAAVDLHYQDTTMINGVDAGTSSVDESSGGYSTGAGGSEMLTVNVESPGAGCSGSTCVTTTVQVTSVSIETPGFSIQSVSPATPFTVSAGDLTFSVTVTSPSSSYSGVVDIYIAETWSSTSS